MKIHLDLDAFFISAERIKNPKLRHIPAAVGGRGDPFIFDTQTHHKIDTIHNTQGAFVPSLFYNADTSFENYFVEGNKIRGIIITASYEARAYGITTGMSVRQALQLCPHLVVVPPNHLFYHHISSNLRQFLEQEIPLVEQFSIDEFFGDLSGWVARKDLPAFLQYLQNKIQKHFSLPISIGVAKSKWIAKLATSFAKPYGIKIVDNTEEFIKDIPIEKFPGIGRGYYTRLKRYGIHTLGQTKEAKNLFYSWKKPGITLFRRIWGMDNEPVLPHHQRKSIGISRTFDPICDRAELLRRLIILVKHLSFTIAQLALQPTFYSLLIKYENGYKTKAHLHSHRIFHEKLFLQIAKELFNRCDRDCIEPVVRISLHCAYFQERMEADLFFASQDSKLYRLLQSSKSMREKFGVDILMWGAEMLGGKAAKN